jgi:hypothetical protein
LEKFIGLAKRRVIMMRPRKKPEVTTKPKQQKRMAESHPETEPNSNEERPRTSSGTKKKAEPGNESRPKRNVRTQKRSPSEHESDNPPVEEESQIKRLLDSESRESQCANCFGSGYEKCLACDGKPMIPLVATKMKCPKHAKPTEMPSEGCTSCEALGRWQVPMDIILPCKDCDAIGYTEVECEKEGCERNVAKRRRVEKKLNSHRTFISVKIEK